MSVLQRLLTAAAGLALSLPSNALAGKGVSISSYGQRSLLIQGGGHSVLLNPYKAVGCAAGLSDDAYRPPQRDCCQTLSDLCRTVAPWALSVLEEG